MLTFRIGESYPHACNFTTSTENGCTDFNVKYYALNGKTGR
jgi:hypothetical protein